MPLIAKWKEPAEAGSFEAERAGFEPAVEFDPYAALAKRCFRPLSHLSGSRRRHLSRHCRGRKWFAETHSSRRLAQLIRLRISSMQPDIKDQPLVAVKHVVISQMTFVDRSGCSTHAMSQGVVGQ
jgi:hypothetical protein